jgi:protein phosphatase
LVVLAGLAVGREIIRSNYYVTAHDGTVAIMRGVPGSILGYPLQEPYRQGCLTSHNGLNLISPGQLPPGCDLFRVSDLKQSEQRQVEAGLPTGTEDEAIGQINKLAQDSLLPLCPREQPKPPAPTAVPHSPAPTNSPGVPNNSSPTANQSPAPETPRTVTTSPASPAPPPASPAPAPEAPGPPPAPESPAPPPPPPPTVTALPPPPPEPGTNCREAA